ncbi:MAG: RAMP superfamily CRISPR-associated protein [Candidatus Hydrothermia bacterium]
MNNQIIFDYYLSNVNLSEDTNKRMVDIGKIKLNILKNTVNEKKPIIFYPTDSDLKNLPQNSTLLKISFTLKKPYTSKDEGEFHIVKGDELFEWAKSDKEKITKYLKKNHNIEIKDIKIEDNEIRFENGVIEIEGNFAILKINEKTEDYFILEVVNGRKKVYSIKILENPIVRDKFTGLPMVKPATWKGHLRFAAERVEWEKEEKKIIIKRLFGSEPEEKDNPLKGRLYFFPTFFNKEAKKDVITPLKRDTRTPARGPIPFEVMKPGKNGDFNLLYFPYPKGDEFKIEEIKKDLTFLAEALKLMFYTYGFSAKKTSGFGVIEKPIKEGKLYIKTANNVQEKNFSKLDELKNEINKLEWKL